MSDSTGEDLDADEEPEIEDEPVATNDTDIKSKNEIDQTETNFLIEIINLSLLLDEL